MGYMRDKIGDPAMYEQLAEECAELGQAALKMARVLRKENPTPVTEDEASAMVLEEAADVLNCINEVGIFDRPELAQITHEKLKRFKTRWEEAHHASEMEMPKEDVKPVAHAHWIKSNYDNVDGTIYECSNCNTVMFNAWNYCPHCGAKMDEQENGAEDES